MLLEHDLSDLQCDLGYREEITPELVGGATVDVWKFHVYNCVQIARLWIENNHFMFGKCYIRL